MRYSPASKLPNKFPQHTNLVPAILPRPQVSRSPQCPSMRKGCARRCAAAPIAGYLWASAIELCLCQGSSEPLPRRPLCMESGCERPPPAICRSLLGGAGPRISLERGAILGICLQHRGTQLSVPCNCAPVSLQLISRANLPFNFNVIMAVRKVSGSCSVRFLNTHPLADGEGHIAVLDHVPDLPLHGQEEKDQPVQQQDGPEHRHVKRGEECRGKAQQQRLC